MIVLIFMLKGAIYIATILNFFNVFFVGGNSLLLSNNYFYMQDASLLKKI